MKVPSLKKIFQKKPADKRARAVLIERARIIWEWTIIGLVFLAIGIILFDGYIFVYKVIDLEDVSAFPTGSGDVQKIDDTLFREIKSTITKRAELFSGAGADFPARNPFVENVEKKK